MAAPLDLQYFQQAGDIYSRLRGNEARMLQQMAQSNQVSPDMQMLMEEEAKFKLREQQKAAYEKWEKDQILNAISADRVKDLLPERMDVTGATDSKGNPLYRESTPSLLAAQQRAAAEEAMRRGKPQYAQEFMANYQAIADAENKRLADAEKNKLDIQLKQAELRGKPKITNTVTVADPNDPTKSIIIDPNSGEKVGDAPMSKEERKVQFDKSKDLKALNVVDSTSKSMTDEIDKLIGSEDGKTPPHPGLYGSVGYIDANEWVPPVTKAQADAQALIKGLLAKTSVQGLQSIRASGAAPGSITEKEWPIFQNYLQTIDPKQSEEQFIQQLKDLRTMMNELRQSAHTNYESRHGGATQDDKPSVGATGSFDEPPPGAVRRK